MYKIITIHTILNTQGGVRMFEIRKPEYVNKTFRMEKSLVERLAKCAGENDISVNALVAQCCEYALSHMKIEEKDNNPNL